MGFPTTTEYTTYVPVGMLIGWDLNCEWNLKLRAQADVPFFHRVHFTGVNIALTKKTKWEFELPITYNPAPFCWDLSFVPFFNRIPRSTTAPFPFGIGTATYEVTQMNTWGARLELGYDF